MSDFVSRLAARSLSPSGDLWPRVPALFEPIREYDGLLAGRHDTAPHEPAQRSVALESEAPKAANLSHAATLAAARESVQEQNGKMTKPVESLLVDPPRAEPAKNPPRESFSAMAPRQRDIDGPSAITAALPPAPNGADARVDPPAPASRLSINSVFPPEEAPPATRTAGNSSHIAGPAAARTAHVSGETPAKPHPLQPLSLQASSALGASPAIPSRSPHPEDVVPLPRREAAILTEESVEIPRALDTSSAKTETRDITKAVWTEDRPVLGHPPAPVTPAAAARAATAQIPFAAPEPSVQVVIGRVEVRAVFPPQTAARNQPMPRSRPTLSLDEYLKRGSGAGR